MIDTIVRLILIYSLWTGWKKGLLMSLLGPLSLIICFIWSVFIFFKTGNYVKAFFISVLGPLTLSIIFTLTIKAWRKISDKKERISYISRFFGGLFNSLWNGIYIILLLIVVPIIPCNSESFQNLQNKIRVSHSYIYVMNLLKTNLSFVNLDKETIAHSLNDPVKFKRITQSSEFNNLMNNENFKKFLLSEGTIELLQKQNLSELIRHPQAKSLLTDIDFIKQILAVNNMLLRELPE